MTAGRAAVCSESSSPGANEKSTTRTSSRSEIVWLRIPRSGTARRRRGRRRARMSARSWRQHRTATAESGATTRAGTTAGTIGRRRWLPIRGYRSADADDPRRARSSSSSSGRRPLRGPSGPRVRLRRRLHPPLVVPRGAPPLDRLAAWRLRALGLEPGDRLLTWSPSTPELPAVYFGAMMARLVLVPLDLRMPRGRDRADRGARRTRRTSPSAPAGTRPTRARPGSSTSRRRRSRRSPPSRTPRSRRTRTRRSRRGRSRDPTRSGSSSSRPGRPARRRASCSPTTTSSRRWRSATGSCRRWITGSCRCSRSRTCSSRRSGPSTRSTSARHPLRPEPEPARHLRGGPEPSRHRDDLRAAGARPHLGDDRARGRADRARRERSPVSAGSPATCRTAPAGSCSAGSTQQLGGELRLIVCTAAFLPPSLQQAWEDLGDHHHPGVRRRPRPGSAPARRARTTAWARWGGRSRRASAASPTTARSCSAAPSSSRATGATRSRARRRSLTDGWYRTGDVGRFDDRGRLILMGRTKDIIVLPNGFNVFPEDIENALRVAGIRDSVVVETQPGRIEAIVLAPGPATMPAGRRRLGGRARRTRGRPGGDEGVDRGRDPQRERDARDQPADPGWRLWPDADFPRTHTLKVRSGPGARLGGRRCAAAGHARRSDSAARRYELGIGTSAPTSGGARGGDRRGRFHRVRRRPWREDHGGSEEAERESRARCELDPAGPGREVRGHLARGDVGGLRVAQLVARRSGPGPGAPSSTAWKTTREARRGRAPRPADTARRASVSVSPPDEERPPAGSAPARSPGVTEAPGVGAVGTAGGASPAPQHAATDSAAPHARATSARASRRPVPRPRSGRRLAAPPPGG